MDGRAERCVGGRINLRVYVVKQIYGLTSECAAFCAATQENGGLARF
jgi:hypothetical protein